MIGTPKSLTDQLMNLSERMAIEMRALLTTVKSKADKSQVDSLGSLAQKNNLTQDEVTGTLSFDPYTYLKSKMEE